MRLWHPPDMPQALSAAYLHVVFSTKERRPFLRDPEMRERLHEYLGGISKGIGLSASEGWRG
jgi:putative transposase